MTKPLSLPSVIHASSPLPDPMRGARLRGFLDAEAEEGGWWAVLPTHDGAMRPGFSGYIPDEERRDFARTVCAALNKDSHHNGVWAVVWFLGGNRFALVWKDWDGEIQIFADEDTPFDEFKNVSPLHWGKHADEMIKTWMTTMLHSVRPAAAEMAKMAGDTPIEAMSAKEIHDLLGKTVESYYDA